MNELELAILELIEKRYKAKYIGGLKVTQLSSGGYKLVLYLSNPDIKPIQIAADLEAEDFLKYIDKELISRLLIKVQWFTGVKIYPEDDEGTNDCKNQSCNC